MSSLYQINQRAATKYAYLDAKAQSEASCSIEGNKEVLAKAKVLKFSSPMCSECIETSEEMKKAMKNYKDSIIVEEINVLESNAEAKKATKKAINKYKVSVVPTLVFLNKDGEMVKKQVGLMKSDEIIEVLDGIK